MDLVIYAIPFFFLAMAIELWVCHKKQLAYYRINDAINSLSLGIISTTSKLVLFDIAGWVFSLVERKFSRPALPRN